MRRTELRKKVLYALAVASVATFVHGGGVPTYAATLNGHKIADGVVEDQDVFDAGSGKFVIGQGNVNIQTDANVNIILDKYQDNGGGLSGLQAAVAPTKPGDVPLVGVVGGEGQLDAGLIQVAGLASMGLQGSNPSLSTMLEKVLKVNTVEQGATDVSKLGNVHVTVGDADGSSPVIIGAVGGDLSVDTAMTGTFTVTEKEPLYLNRTGDINIGINNGNVLGGVGASAAISVGNMTIDGKVNVLGIDMDVHETLNGNSTTILNGNVTTTVSDKANLGAFANGGGAAAIGGTATSTVTGDTTLNLNGGGNVMKGGINGLNVGVAGGGAAVSTIGGTAESVVEGSSTVNVNDGLVIGMAGGGVAAAVDATGAVEAIKGGQIGNDDGTSDTTISGFTVTVADAIQGGSATATTGDTNINLTGNTTAFGVIGGGVAASTHTYTWKGDGTADGEHAVNDAYGSSKATANTGKATIVVDLDSQEPDNVAANIGGALSSVIGAVKDGNLDNINADGVVGQGAAVGVFGGGVAFGHGSYRSFIGSEDVGAYSVANNEDGADIYLLKGYAAGVFGGGAAGTVNNAKAETNTGVVNTYVGEDMKAVGIFGGGFALSMEGETSDIDTNGTKGTLASSNVEQNNIVVDGDVDGIYGGGMAIGNSNLGRETSADAATHVGMTNITVNNGTVDRLQLISIMQASKNDNTDGAPWWNSLGMNASMAMADLKGITDETSIAAGGMGMGMTGSDTVDVANVTINGGTVTKDILGGGIAVDNMREGSGAHVGTSTITLNGGTVEGSVYAGGAINGTTPSKVLEELPLGVEGHTGYNTDATSSTVDNATVVLNGGTVAGEISGQGYEMTTKYAADDDFNPFNENGRYEATYEKSAYNSVTNSTLVLAGDNTLSALDNTDKKYTSDSKIHDFDNVKVEANSVTKLDNSVKPGTTALIDGGTVIVDSTARLDISELDKTGSPAYNIAANYNEGSTFWSDDNLVYDRMAAYATSNATAGGAGSLYTITYDTINETNWKDAADSMGKALNAGPVQPLIDQGMKLGWDTNKGISEGARDYFRDWMYNPNMNAAFGRGMMIGEDSAVTGNTVSVARDVADEVSQHLSFTEDFVQDHDSIYGDDNIWAKYIHNKFETDGMSSSFGDITADNDYNGVIVGYDFNQSGKLQSGVAIHYGHGDGTGSFSRNDYDAWGVSLYGALKDEEAGTNLMADIGYTKTTNDISGTIAGKDLTADRDLTAWTIGVRGEKEFVSGKNQIVPYVGLRYMNVDPSSYTSYYNGKKAFEYDADKQDIWMVPLGVSFRNETKTGSGWRITPKLDVAYIWAFGDTDNEVDVNMAGASAPLYYTVMDDGSWLASLGIDASHGAWTFGAGYAYQKGDDTKNNKWYVNAGFAF